MMFSSQIKIDCDLVAKGVFISTTQLRPTSLYDNALTYETYYTGSYRTCDLGFKDGTPR